MNHLENWFSKHNALLTLSGGVHFSGSWPALIRCFAQVISEEWVLFGKWSVAIISCYLHKESYFRLKLELLVSHTSYFSVRNTKLMVNAAWTTLVLFVWNSCCPYFTTYWLVHACKLGEFCCCCMLNGDQCFYKRIEQKISFNKFGMWFWF